MPNQEQLQLVAEVADKFSQPIRQMRDAGEFIRNIFRPAMIGLGIGAVGGRGGRSFRRSSGPVGRFSRRVGRACLIYHLMQN
jgi:hypothetical protein